MNQQDSDNNGYIGKFVREDGEIFRGGFFPSEIKTTFYFSKSSVFGFRIIIL